MSGDAYSRLARLQDAVLEPLNAPLRDIVVAMATPHAGTRVIDVGCGTGKQLDRFLTKGCAVAGVDNSPAMLARARAALGDRADLRLADAQSLPFADASFDIVTATLVLHELTPEARVAVAKEMLRVLTEDGSIVVVDFHVGPLRGFKGRLMRGASVIAELMARHLRRSRAFLAGGGVPALAEQLGTKVRETKVLAGGNLAIYQLSAK
jgi:ubiquinone/menaquinone biosynthesis C-methylase UbiE